MKEMILQLAIKVNDAELPITSLSGGNQQKVVLGKSVDDPATGGVLMNPHAALMLAQKQMSISWWENGTTGLAVMFSSSELDEVMALADRILRWLMAVLPLISPGRSHTRETDCGFNTSRLIRLEFLMNQKYMIYMHC